MYQFPIIFHAQTKRPDEDPDVMEHHLKLRHEIGNWRDILKRMSGNRVTNIITRRIGKREHFPNKPALKVDLHSAYKAKCYQMYPPMFFKLFPFPLADKKPINKQNHEWRDNKYLFGAAP